MPWVTIYGRHSMVNPLHVTREALREESFRNVYWQISLETQHERIQGCITISNAGLNAGVGFLLSVGKLIKSGGGSSTNDYFLFDSSQVDSFCRALAKIPLAMTQVSVRHHLNYKMR